MDFEKKLEVIEEEIEKIKLNAGSLMTEVRELQFADKYDKIKIN